MFHSQNKQLQTHNLQTIKTKHTHTHTHTHAHTHTALTGILRLCLRIAQDGKHQIRAGLVLAAERKVAVDLHATHVRAVDHTLCPPARGFDRHADNAPVVDDVRAWLSALHAQHDAAVCALIARPRLRCAAFTALVRHCAETKYS